MKHVEVTLRRALNFIPGGDGNSDAGWPGG